MNRFQLINKGRQELKEKEKRIEFTKTLINCNKDEVLTIYNLFTKK